jgi:hypothetical protein
MLLGDRKGQKLDLGGVGDISRSGGWVEWVGESVCVVALGRACEWVKL